MIKEFAIEPKAVVLDPSSLLYHLGPVHGRFITNDKSRSWHKGIVKHFEASLKSGDLSYLQSQLIDEWLTSQKQTDEQAIYITTQDHDGIYDDDISTSSKFPPDSCIVTHDGRNNSFKSAGIAKNEEWWLIDSSQDIAKTREEYLRILGKIISIAKRIVIIDPYISNSPRHLSLLGGMADLINTENIERITIVFAGSSATWREKCRQIAEKFKGMDVEFIRGEQFEVDDRILRPHDRFILTDVASCISTYGLEDEDVEGRYGNHTIIARLNYKAGQARIESLDSNINVPRIDVENKFKIMDRFVVSKLADKIED